MIYLWVLYWNLRRRCRLYEMQLPEWLWLILIGLLLWRV